MLKLNNEAIYAKKTDFYLLKQKSIREGDIFVTDYIKTKQRVIRLEKELEVIKLQYNLFKSKKVVKLFDE